MNRERTERILRKIEFNAIPNRREKLKKVELEITIEVEPKSRK